MQTRRQKKLAKESSERRKREADEQRIEAILENELKEEVKDISDEAEYFHTDQKSIGLAILMHGTIKTYVSDADHIEELEVYRTYALDDETKMNLFRQHEAHTGTESINSMRSNKVFLDELLEHYDDNMTPSKFKKVAWDASKKYLVPLGDVGVDFDEYDNYSTKDLHRMNIAEHINKPKALAASIKSMKTGYSHPYQLLSAIEHGYDWQVTQRDFEFTATTHKTGYQFINKSFQTETDLTGALSVSGLFLLNDFRFSGEDSRGNPINIYLRKGSDLMSNKTFVGIVMHQQEDAFVALNHVNGSIRVPRMQIARVTGNGVGKGHHEALNFIELKDIVFFFKTFGIQNLFIYDSSCESLPSYITDSRTKRRLEGLMHPFNKTIHKIRGGTATRKRRRRTR
jgi:hypothetical protein